MSRVELIELVRRLQNADHMTEADGDRLLEELERNLPGPGVSDLMFWHQPPLTAEEIVDLELNDKPTTLGPGK